MSGGLQVRLGMFVYVQDAGENLSRAKGSSARRKKRLVRPDEAKNAREILHIDAVRRGLGMPLHASRWARVFTVPHSLGPSFLKKLWRDHKGVLWMAGVTYLPPDKTVHFAQQTFHPVHERVRSDVVIVQPLDCVLKECFVLSYDLFCRGRPRGVHEDDVYFCRYRVNTQSGNSWSTPRDHSG